jgi:transcriptional repressor NrdR
MRCSQCKEPDTKVIESRDVAEGQAIRRRRSCQQCQFRFTTYERIERPNIIVIKNNGSRELFNRDKILAGVYRACEKTPVTTLQAERLVHDVEQQIYACGEQEVSSSDVGAMIMEKLADLNEVAYVRFASVYRRFEDVASFEQELSRIRKHKSASAK